MARKIGLALGAGAARGYAHIGVLKVLDEEKIPIDFIAGTSIGALAGAIYASGISAKEMEELVLTRLSHFLEPVRNVIENPFVTLTGKLKTIQESPSIFTVILQTTAIMEHQILNLQLKSSKPDILIEPKVGFIKPLEFYRGKEGIVKGEIAARHSLSKYDLSYRR